MSDRKMWLCNSCPGGCFLIIPASVKPKGCPGEYGLGKTGRWILIPDGVVKITGGDILD